MYYFAPVKKEPSSLAEEKANLPDLKNILNFMKTREGHAKTPEYSELIKSTVTFLEREIIYLEDTPT